MHPFSTEHSRRTPGSARTPPSLRPRNRSGPGWPRDCSWARAPCDEPCSGPSRSPRPQRSRTGVLPPHAALPWI